MTPDQLRTRQRIEALIRLMSPALDVIAWHDSMVMAVAHRSAPAWGVQFHAESILTMHGPGILANVLQLSAAARRRGAIFQHGSP